MTDFPIYNYKKIFNFYPYKDKNKNLKTCLNEIKIFYPCRLDAMAINPAAVAINDDNMKFGPGEVVVSIGIGVNVHIKVLNESGGNLIISQNTKRKVLIKHAYCLMCDALNVRPSLFIDVDSSKIIKHCGFGSSSSVIAGVCAAINEIYGKKIKNKDLIKYLAGNHGEEVSEENQDDLKAVQCIGGGATNGLTKEGIIIIAGQATTIAKMNYNSKVLIAIPRKFKVRDANEMMLLEEQNLYKFKKTGEKYKDIIAYRILHSALPDMANGKIDGLAKIVYDYRFYMGSNKNCSFVYPPLNKISEKLKVLYEEGHCDFLSLSSVGPAFFCFVKDKKNQQYCKDYFEKLDMHIYETNVNNNDYKILEKIK